MISKILLVMLLSCISSCLYRLGGASKEDQDLEFPWIPRWFKNLPKKRDLGCGLCVMLAGLILGINAPFLAWFFSVGLMWGGLSTYHDTMFYNWMKPKDNHILHMFIIGLGLFPVMFYAFPVQLGIRCLTLALLGGAGSTFIDEVIQPRRSDIVTELLRGFVLPFTLLGVLI